MLRGLPESMRERLVRATSPSYTVGSVCRIEHDGQVLLVETEYRRGWGYPGGLVDRHELPDAGARREVLEEVGLTVELAGEPIVIIDAGNRLVDVLYRAVLAPGVGMGDARAASIEITQVEWVPAEFAVARVEATSDRVNHKLRYFDSHPDGGVVFYDNSLD
jgi:8-oxo-dGTP pyrophosphatase MutT (NUDIX family)